MPEHVDRIRQRLLQLLAIARYQPVQHLLGEQPTQDQRRQQAQRISAAKSLFALEPQHAGDQSHQEQDLRERINAERLLIADARLRQFALSLAQPVRRRPGPG